MLAAGDQVLYVPEPDVHGMDVDGRGDFCFHFRHLEDGVRGAHGPHRKGDRAHVNPRHPGERLQRHGGVLHTHDGHRVEPHEAKAFWPATVTAVHDDGSATIEIRHPHSWTLEYRRRHSAGKEPGTFHRPGE